MKNQQVDLPGQPTPVTNFVDPPTSPSRDTGIAAGSPKSKNFTSITSPPYVVSYNPLTSSLPPDPSELAQIIVTRDKTVGLFYTFMEDRGLPKLHILNASNRPTSPLLN